MSPASLPTGQTRASTFSKRVDGGRKEKGRTVAVEGGFRREHGEERARHGAGDAVEGDGRLELVDLGLDGRDAIDVGLSVLADDDVLRAWVGKG